MTITSLIYLGNNVNNVPCHYSISGTQVLDVDHILNSKDNVLELIIFPHLGGLL